MPLSVGDRLGHYEVLSLLGQGGMGEVYRAKDTKLDRDVAIKVLPQVLARDPERLARFEREAKVLASLDHPNIGHIHGIVDSEDSRALVLALIEGPTLADRIEAGPIPLDEALAISKQIIEALEYAHDRGVVHRDLKPANVKITSEGVVKVLDFGLAKVLEDEPAVSSMANSPTLTLGHTRAGVILGTAAYMSPEQAVGRAVDRRSDIFSFGAVLYEMLSGKRVFFGAATPDVLEAVVKNDPDWSALPAGTPKYLQRLLERTLAKDRKQRLQAIGEARIALESPEAASTPATTGPRRWWVAAMASVCGILILIAAALGFGWWRATRPVDHPLIRLSADLGPDAVSADNLTVAISPDGTRITYPSRGADGKPMLATRLLDQAAPTILSGTDNAISPFFSPDGKWIGFFADNKLKKISVLGGAALTITDVRQDRGATWTNDSSIIFSPDNSGGLWLVPDAGGTPQPLTKPPDRGEATHRWPQILPGGKAVIFTAKAPDLGKNLGPGYDDANIEALSLKTGEIKILQRGGFYGRYLPSGHLVYVHQGVLFGVRFDPDKLEVHGSPAPMLEDVAANGLAGGGQIDLSATGTLVYLSGRGAMQARWPVVWLDNSGKIEPLLAKPGTYGEPRFSPDGNLLALSVLSAAGRDIYVYDWHHDTMPRLTFTGGANRAPVWTPDGKHIVFYATGELDWIRADGASQPERLIEAKNGALPFSFSPDGKRLVYTTFTGKAETWILPLDLGDPEHPKAGKPEPFLVAPADGYGGMVSPDGHWIAYVSAESGTQEAYVRPFPGLGGKWQISTGGARSVLWSRSGHELLYGAPNDRIMVTAYSAKGESFSYSKPRVWSDTPIFYPAGSPAYFDVAPDGKRAAVFARPDTGEQKQGNLHVTFLLNFADELRRRIPTK